ncbi:DENN-domain-containing protein, partial [Hortaea werneckii]
MSDEERELASSLGERLSAERAKLSRLLAELPTMQSGSEDREKLEDEISTVEEKIGLMTDLLRPVRHGAASKIDGLTEGDTGFWIPRAYGILGRDETLMPFWKEWLKATITPMTNGAILRVPASSPKVGIWQPLERYVVNLCVEALSPITSVTQVEIGVRELRLYARKEAINEIPGSRNVDLYALFRCLTIPNIITLFEYALSESRIILLSSHTAMLHLACSALTNLLYPLKWAGVMIPVLPARLIQALEAPCPYIAGVERRYEKLELPDDDFCLVDLDEDIIEITGPPTTLPRPQRRKLQSLLQIAAPHHNRFGVPTGPPPYAIETFPCDAFSSENPQ